MYYTLQMLFNGLVHFPGNSLIEEMQRIGIDIGPHINAYVRIEIMGHGTQIEYHSENQPNRHGFSSLADLFR
jgi:hypothetical protein